MWVYSQRFFTMALLPGSMTPSAITSRAGVAPDLRHRLGPADSVAATIDPLVRQPMRLSSQEEADLIQFLRTGLLDTRAQASEICTHVPATLPSGAVPLTFQGCP
jgi:hypothetical protein